MMRLDKLLAHAGYGTRKEVKELIKDKRVSVNGCTNVKDKTQVDEFHDEICVDDITLTYEKNHFVMLHKPAGVITATSDTVHETVMDCIDEFIGTDMFPVGRLDIDTEGLVLICNDGKLAHQLLSPKHHVDKTYEVHIKHPLTEKDIATLEHGMDLGDFTTKRAKVTVIEDLILHLTIQEGKFHQVKRMLEGVDNCVMYLKRISFGPLVLDEALAPGEWRYLDEDEVSALYAIDRRE